MKKVLFIAYHFPPDASIGAVRPAKFAKYLPEFGWEPIVYTVEESCYDASDPGKFEEALKSISIFRVEPIPGPLDAYSRLISSHQKVSAADHHTQELQDHRNETVGLTKRLFSSLLRIPDGKQGWILNIARDCYRIVKKHRIGVFLTSGPPMSSHLGGALLKCLTGARWVADFRDPWWGSLRWMGPQFRTNVSDTITKKLEALVIKKADMVISTAPQLTEYFRALLPSHQREKCVTITNGFDENDFTAITQTPEGPAVDRIRITHSGSLYAGRNPEPFFVALGSLIRRGELTREDVEIEFIGSGNEYNGIPLIELIKKHNLSQVVNLLDSMPHKACLERLAQSHGLLLFAQDFAEQVPAKIFEYLRIDRPIFAVITDGDAKRILEPFQNTFMADPHVNGDMEIKFMQMLNAIRDGVNISSEKRYVRFDRRELTKELAHFLGQET